MTNDEATRFLAQPWVGMLGITAPGRGPLTIPVWYSLDADGRPWFVSPKTTLKSRLIEAEGRFTLTAQRETRPYAYVSVEGPASLVTAVPDDIKQMAIRYLGEDAGSEFGENMRDVMEAGTRWRITLTPERWSSYGLGT